MAIDYKKTGRAISACRQELKLSQQGLAELMNVTHQAVSKWENGAALPDTPTLLALSKLFGVTMEELLMGEIAPKGKAPMESMDEQLKAMNEQLNGKAQQPTMPNVEKLKEMAMTMANRAMEKAAAAQEKNEMQQNEIHEMAKALQSEIETQMRDVFEAQEAEIQAQAEEELQAIEGFDVLEEGDEAEELPETITEAQLSHIMGMLPFVSTSMADQLFEKIAGQDTMPMSQLGRIAPFVSTRALNDYVMRLIDQGLTHEDARKGLMTIAPFLNQKTLERLIHSELCEIDAKLAQNLLPFVNTKTADALVKRMMTEQNFAQSTPADDADPREKRADIRWRIALKAMESGNIDWLEEHADELTDAQQGQLANMAMERGDRAMLEALIDAAAPQVLERLLEKAIEMGDWELIEQIEEQL